MSDFKTNEEFFEAFNNLIEKIKIKGNSTAAHQLRLGFSCLNGLTDGWALLMDSIESTIKENARSIDGMDLSELQKMLKTVKKIVYR